jgi:hypothetical protein
MGVASLPNEMDETSGQAAPIPCPACGLGNPAPQRFCSGCGAALQEASSRRRARPEGDSAERARARHEFGRIKSIVLTVRAVFLAGAVLAALMLLQWLVMGHVLVARGSEWLTTLVRVLLIGELVLMVAGAALVVAMPLPWTTVAACYWTLGTAIGLWADDWALPPVMLVRLFLVASFWFAVGQAARVQRLIAADPTLQIVRKKLDPSRRVVGGIGDDARQRHREEKRRRRNTMLRLAGVVLVGLVGIGFAIRQITKPPAVDAALAGFRAAWTKNDLDALTEGFDGGKSARAATALREGIERRGWQAQLPVLAEPVVDVAGKRAVAKFPDPVAVRAVFALQRAVWQLQDVGLPPLVAPDVSPAIAQFRKAWSAKGTAELVALFRPEARERVGGVLVRLLEKRSWHEQRPALGDVDPGRVSGGKARVVFAIDNDEMTVAFDWWHPEWRLSGVSL